VKNRELSTIWIKASITGTIWAASEIVLGSFLHNLKIPFSGSILTTIGLIILISISHIWTEKGIFWRAGLICAIMKTLSPSAVIFGPMIAIISESLLLELSVRLLGRTYAGYIIGAMMATSWNLFQKIINYIIFYGSNIVEVYANLLKYAQKQLNIQIDIVWMPILILLFIYSLFGLFAAVTGIKTGIKLKNRPTVSIPENIINYSSKNTTAPKDKFNYSLGWLAANVLFLVGAFVLLNYTSWIVWSSTITIITLIWALRYKRALRQLSRPKFWIFFVFITLITAFVFTKAQSGENVLKEGLLTGFQMNFRAVLIIVGFAVLGTELYNPVIRSFFLKTSFKHLPTALELSTESLPYFIASIPDFKTLIRNPVSIFYQVLSHAEKRLSEIEDRTAASPLIFIVSGGVGDGKTTYVKNLLALLKKNNISAGGIISERVMTETQTTGYDIVDIDTNDSEILLRQNDESTKERIGRFAIYDAGFRKGTTILSSTSILDKTIVVIDEIGKLELQDKGWSASLQQLIKKSENNILITVRDNLVEEVVKKFNLKDPFIYRVAETDYLNAGKSILELITNHQL
jgi:nucleoside-triphosphatase THEP1